jgi:protein O-GlcNAc transferase
MVKASAEELVRRLASSENTSALNIKRSPESAEELKETGIKYFYAGNLNAAGSYYRRAIQSKPDFAEAHNNLGTVLRKRNRPQSAIAAFQTALLLNPQSGFTYGNLGNLYERYGNLAQAETYYLKAVGLAPDLYQGFVGLARIAAHRLRWDEALAALRRASAIAPQDASILHQTGVVYLSQGDLPAALNSLRNADSLEPNNATIKACLADVLFHQGKNEEARALAEESLALNPSEAVAKTVIEKLGGQDPIPLKTETLPPEYGQPLQPSHCDGLD